jgi:Zn-dependent protease
MNRSLKLGRIAGIGIYVHWTFLLLLAYVFLDEFGGQHGTERARALAGAEAVAFILFVFLCVTLHELGHAFAARRYGIQTRDITLLPIGGVARLERIPEKAGQELVIAIAGPLVNVIIAAALLPIVIAVFGRAGLHERLLTGNFLLNLLITNVVLVLFNLIPAFPMDGGRVLRALLAFRLDYVTATLIAARTGQVVAIGFAAFAIWRWNPMLVLVAVFVLLAAQGELQAVRMRFAVRRLTVRDAGITPSSVLRLDEPLAEMAQDPKRLTHQIYAISDGDRLAAASRADLLAALSTGDQATRIRDVPRCYPGVVQDTDPLDRAVAVMNESGVPVLAVLSGNEFAGFVTADSISRLIQARTAGRGAAGGRDPARSPLPPPGRGPAV